MSKTDELAKAYSGLLGDQVVVMRGGKGRSVVSLAKTRSKRAPSDKQLAVRERLGLAAQYARNAMLDPVLCEMYTKRARTGLPPFRVAAIDYLQPPYIREIDASGYHGGPGDVIRVKAGDKIALAEARAVLKTPDGITVEEAPQVAGKLFDRGVAS